MTAPITLGRAISSVALPEVIYVETSNTCNSLCEMCPLTYFGNGTPHHLTCAELESIVRQFPTLKRVVLHGLGEPLLNRELAGMIQYLTERGIETLFNSNVIALTRRRQEELVRAGLNELRVSLDAATNETYKRVRGVPAFDKVVRHLAEMVETRATMVSKTPKISVWFTTMRENLPELSSAVRIAAEAGADEFYVQRLVYADYGLATEEQSIFGKLHDEELDQLRAAEETAEAFGMTFRASGDTVAIETLEGVGAQRDELPVLQSTRPWLACHRPWYLTYITAHGDVLPCCFIPFINASSEPAYVLGNIFEQSAESIWNGPAYQDFRQRFQSDCPPASCASCGSRWSV